MNFKWLLSAAMTAMLIGASQVAASAACTSGTGDPLAPGSITCDTTDDLSNWAVNVIYPAALPTLLNAFATDYSNGVNILNTSHNLTTTYQFTSVSQAATSVTTWVWVWARGISNGVMTYDVNINTDFTGDTKNTVVGDTNYFSLHANIAAVPGPEAGTGLGALAIAGIAMIALRRGKNQSLTA